MGKGSACKRRAFCLEMGRPTPGWGPSAKGITKKRVLCVADSLY